MTSVNVLCFSVTKKDRRNLVSVDWLDFFSPLVFLLDMLDYLV